MCQVLHRGNPTVHEQRLFSGSPQLIREQGFSENMGEEHRRTQTKYLKAE